MRSSEGSVVRRFRAPPATRIVKRSDWPSGRAPKASSRPSGDQAITPGGPPNDVTGTGFEPSGSAIQTSQAPDRVDAKAIFLPSGEYRGIKSLRVDAIKR